MYFNCCNCSSYTKAVTKKKKEIEKDISLCNLKKKKVDWVVKIGFYSSSTFIDQERDCHYGI